MPERNKMSFGRAIKDKCKNIWLSHIKAESSIVSPLYMGEKTYRRVSTLVLGLMAFLLLFSSIFLNIALNNSAPTYILVIFSCIPVVSCLWVLRNRHTTYAPAVFLLCALAVVCIMLVINAGVVQSVNFVWLLLLPPMAMACLGIKFGSVFLSVFFLVLVLLFWPLDFLVADKMPLAVKLRFLISFFGSYVFAAFVEDMRHRTNRSLAKTVVRLEQEALTDPLTGLGNRRDFQKHFAWLKAKSQRAPSSIALAMIDIDHFKKINDTYGHDIGDKVLRHITHVLASHLRATDRLFRWGGEEFILLMADTHPEDARLAAERVRHFVEASPYIYNGEPIKYSVSIGLYCSQDTPDINEAIAEADKYLYTAKRSGRNQVVCEYCM